MTGPAPTGPAPDQVGTFADLAARIVASPPGLGPVRVVAVDGPAGSGKTTFAGQLAAAVRAAGHSVAEIQTDDLLDGWTDLETFWPRLAAQVLDPLRRGEPGRYRAYDWWAGRFDQRWHPVPVPEVLVLDGVSCGRATLRPELTLLVWVEAPEAVRQARWLSRDGDDLATEWVRWRAAEAGHFASQLTQQAADLHVDGAPVAEIDQSAQFVHLAGGRGGQAGGPSEETRAGEREAVR